MIVPTVENFHKLMSVMDTVFGVQNESFEFGQQEYGKEEQATVIWHEATHAWQFTNYKKQILKRMDADTSTDLNQQIDEKVEVVALYKQEMEFLLQAVQAESIDAKKAYVLKYKELEEQRKQYLSTDVLMQEEYYESVEEIAYYVESKVYEMLKGTTAYEILRYWMMESQFQTNERRLCLIHLSEAMRREFQLAEPVWDFLLLRRLS